MIKEEKSYKNILLNISELLNKDHLKFKVRFMTVGIFAFFIILFDILYLNHSHSIYIADEVKKISNYSSLDYFSYTISNLIGIGYKDDYKYMRESIILFIRYNVIIILCCFMLTRLSQQYDSKFWFWIMNLLLLTILTIFFILKKDYGNIVFIKNIFLIFSYIYIIERINSYLINIDNYNIVFFEDYNSKIYFLISSYYVIFSLYEGINHVYYIIYIINILNISVLVSLFFKEFFLLLLATSISNLSINLFIKTIDYSKQVKIEGDKIYQLTYHIIHAKNEVSFSILFLLFICIISARNKILRNNRIISKNNKIISGLILFNLILLYFPFINNSYTETGNAVFSFSLYLFIFYTYIKEDLEKLNITNLKYINFIFIIISYLLLLSSLHFCDFVILTLFKIFTENSVIQIIEMFYIKIVIICCSFLFFMLFRKTYTSYLKNEKKEIK